MKGTIVSVPHRPINEDFQVFDAFRPLAATALYADLGFQWASSLVLSVSATLVPTAFAVLTGPGQRDQILRSFHNRGHYKPANRQYGSSQRMMKPIINNIRHRLKQAFSHLSIQPERLEIGCS